MENLCDIGIRWKVLWKTLIQKYSSIELPPIEKSETKGNVISGLLKESARKKQTRVYNLCVFWNIVATH